jgi:hypothetical protein
MASMLYSHLPQVVGIVGAGQMGSGIAQVRARVSHSLCLHRRGARARNKTAAAAGARSTKETKSAHAYTPLSLVCRARTTRAHSRSRGTPPPHDKPAPRTIIIIICAPAHTCDNKKVCAMKGLEVLLSDRSADILERGMTSIKKSLHRMVQKGAMPDEAAREALGKVKTVVELEVCVCCACCGGGCARALRRVALRCVRRGRRRRTAASAADKTNRAPIPPSSATQTTIDTRACTHTQNNQQAAPRRRLCRRGRDGERERQARHLPAARPRE